MKVTIDLGKLKKMVAEGEKIFLNPEAGEALRAILEAEEQIEQIKEEAKKRLAELAFKLNPNFKSISSDTVRVSVRSFGAKYYVDETQLDLIPPELFRTEVDVIAPNASFSKVKELLEKNNITIKVKKSKDGTEKPAFNYVTDSKLIDKWVKEHKGMPAGITEPVREKSVSFSKKEVRENE